MKLVFLSIFVGRAFAQNACPPDKTFVALQPILNQAKVSKESEDRFKHRDQEDLTPEKITMFEKAMNAHLKKFDDISSAGLAKLESFKDPKSKAYLSISFEERLNTIPVVNQAQEIANSKMESNIEATALELKVFQQRFPDQLSERFLSLGKLDQVKKSISVFRQIISDNENRSVALDHQFTEYKKTFFRPASK